MGGVASGSIMGGSYAGINKGMSKLQQLAQDKVNAEQEALHKLATEKVQAEQQKMAAERGMRYKMSAINQSVLQLVDRVKKGLSSANDKVQLNPVSDDIAAKIQEITGVDVRGFNVAIEARQIEHILKDHGENGASDRSMANPEDIAKIQYALESPDSIRPAGSTRAYVTNKNGQMKPADTILYEKQNGDGSYYVVQAVPDTKKKTLYVVTAFIGKSGYKNTEAPQSTNANSPGATPAAESAVASTNSISQTEAGVNGEISSSEGQVVRSSDGAAVQIADVENAGGGKLTVKLTDGSTADISELSFPNMGEQELWRVLAEYSDNAEDARQLLKEYRAGNLGAFEYAKGVEEAFLYGKLNIDGREMSRRGSFVNRLNPMQKNMAYKYGQFAGEKQTKRRDAEASERNAKRERKGGVYYGYEGEKLDKSKLNKAQRVGVNFAERLARRKGITTYFYRSYVNEQGERVYKDREGNIVPANENGWYDPSDGSIHIDLNCGDMGSTVLCTIAHELTHFIQDWSADKYRTLCKILTEGYLEMGQSVDELVRNKQEEYRKRKIELSYEEAFDEVIASSMEGVLSDGRVMDLLDDVETRDMSLADRIRTFLEETAELIRDTIQAYRDVKPESPEGKIVQRMQGIHDQLQEVFAAGLHEGGENYRQGGKINTAQAGGVKRSIVALENGNVYVQASRNVITGTTKAQQRQNITDFFAALLDGNTSMDIHTIEGDVLTITKKDTSSKARDDYKTTNGVSVAMTGSEFAVKLRAEAHIDELAEVSRGPKNQRRTPDGKNHSFAKNGFTYRRAYFEDFDGQYYEITISVGHNGSVATVYNVGKIDKSTLPSAKIIAVVGSKPLGKVLSNKSIRNPQKKVNKNSATNSPKSIRYQKNALAQEQLERKGGVYYGYEGEKLDKSKLNKAQRVGVNFAERLARRKGITTYFYRSYVNEQGERVYKDREGNIVPANENGWYDPSDGSIHIDLNCGDMGSTVLCTIAHELTHFIQDWSADKYRTLCKILTEGYLEMGQSVDELVRNKQEEYRKRKIELSYEEAFDEVIASSMEGVLSDGRVMDLLDDVETRDMSLADRIRTFLEETAELIRDTIQAYRDVKPESPEGKIVQRMQGIHDQLQEVFAAGLHEGGENYRQGGKINTAQTGGVKMQLRNVNGANVVWIENSSFTNSQLRDSNAIASYIASHIGDVYRIIESGQCVYIGPDLPGEYTHSKYTSHLQKKSKATLKAKNKATPGIGEMIEIATNRRWEKTRHNHSKDAQYGMYRYDTQFAFPIKDRSGNTISVKAYSAELLIRNASDGKKYLYDIVNIKEDTAKAIDLQNREARKGSYAAASRSSVSQKQYTQSGAKSQQNSATNSPKSIRYEKNEAAEAHLQRENAAMGEDVAGLNELVAAMRRQGKDGSLETSTLDAAAATLMKKVNAKGKKAELMQLLDRFYQYVGRGQELTWEDIRKAARPAVNWLIDHIALDERMSELEFAYNRELMEQELLYRIYGSYWNASTLYIVAGQHEANERRLRRRSL